MQRYFASTELPVHLLIGVTVGRLKRSVITTAPAVIVAGLFTERSTTKGPAMKAAIIAGCVVLSVLSAPGAYATGKGDTLPPAEFDKPFTDELHIVRVPNMKEMGATCKETSKFACATRPKNVTYCVMFLLPEKQIKARGQNALAFILRHELGHCNGWPGDHPNGRNVTKEYQNGHIAMPVMPPIIKELPVYSSVVCVTPDWKQEPCSERKYKDEPNVWAKPVRTFKVKPTVECFATSCSGEKIP
jgi:hypothetical protein